jgi:hypothetical protein
MGDGGTCVMPGDGGLLMRASNWMPLGACLADDEEKKD